MKNAIILVLILSTSSAMLPAQDRNLSSIPVTAGRHLQAHYPDAIVEDWYQIDDMLIKARFLLNESSTTYTTAIYTNEGIWQETWATLPLKEVPNEIIEGATTTYPGFRPVQVIWCSTPDRATVYEVAMENESRQAVLFKSDEMDVTHSILAVK